MVFYRICQIIGNIIFRLIFRIKIIGKKNIPKEGGAIICANHTSNFDPVILGVFINRPIHYMAKKELFDNFFLRTIISSLGAFPVNRSSADLSTIRNSIRILRKGKILGIFPEGTRSINHKTNNVKPGIAFMSIKGKAPVIPIYIDANYRIFKTIRIIIGKPIYLDQYYDKKLTNDDYKFISEDIMKTLYLLK